ncbi:MAG TPA: ATP-binding protein [Glaciihabitans sp.]|nr:ATP-binding protein [Glaciihabitans sp.]
MTDLYSRVMRYLSVDHPTLALKQLPVAMAFAIGIALILLVPDVIVVHELAASIGIGVMVGATVLAAIFTRVERLERYAIAIPLLDLIAIGFFRLGTGGGSSVFSALLILPVVWIAAERGRRHIIIAAVGTAVAMFLPLITVDVPSISSSDLLRGFFSPFVFAIAAAIINELSRQSRVQLESIRRLADDKEVILQRTVEFANQLQDSEAQIRAGDRLFRNVWAAVTEQSIIGSSVTGLIDNWNAGAEKLFGLSSEETEGKRYIFEFHVAAELNARSRELNYPPGETVLNPGFSALVESARLGRAESREWTYVRDDGTEVPVLLSVTKRVDDAGNTSGYLFVASDVTQSREVARLKDEFVGLISHELRTPLSSILGYLELLRDDEDNPLSDEQNHYLSVAERNAHRLLRLVGDLLFTAQVESGKFPLDSHPIELDRIVSAAVESARPVANAAGITVEQVLPDVTPWVHGDAIRLGQACDNLISNAIKFTPRGGIVTVALAAHNGSAEITVRDTGMGIAASELDQLYSRFFRASTATRNAVPGVGLGLTITKAIVTAHRGELDVESEEGVGTCFSVKLALIAAPAPV